MRNALLSKKTANRTNSNGRKSTGKVRAAEDAPQTPVQYAIERQQAERTLAESEERYRLLIENSPDGYLVHCDGRVVFANAASLRMFGADRMDQLMGRPILDCFSPEFHDIARERIRNALANRSNPLLEVLGVRLDGATVEMEAIGSPFTHEGRPAVQMVLHDISERRRAEQRVREQASMLDQTRDAIIVRDLHTGRITFWNHGAERMYGWTAAEAIGSDARELICVDPHVLDPVDEELLRAGEWNGEYRKVTKAGKELTISSHVTLVRDSRGGPKSALAIDIDVTGQKELEARYLRAQRMESIGTLASGVAHDLNNILAPIMMSVPSLRHAITAEQRETIIATIETAAERGALIVKQVLTFGRGLQGDRLPLRVAALVNEVLEIMTATFPKNLVVERSLDGNLWPVMGDATQLHQILLNLCVNARDAMPDGGTLRLHAANIDLDASYASMLPEAAPGPYVLLEVSDTGSGIPPEIIERIFDPFFTTKGIGEGSGLGLSTVLGIVKSHGGFIQVHTQPGNGTIFHIYLPASPGLEAAPADYSQEPIPRGNGELVLVVDDEASVAGVAGITLENAGYRVLIATDGAQALAMFATHSGTVAAIFTDLMMPFVDGMALIRAVRRLAPALPIIASTGLGEKAQLSQLKAMGVKTVLHKPFHADTLLLAIHDGVHPHSQ
jgi:two-component system cell cycle sensor histidine kinase/response regulator CckA